MKLKDWICKYIFPPRCIFCRKILEVEGVCERCASELPYRSTERVKDTINFVDEAYSCLHYEGDVRNSILRYKFGGLQKYAVDYAAYLADCVESNLAGRYDIITWVPLSKKRLHSRGYDQARLLAEELCIRIHEPQPVRTLRKRINAAPQSRQGERSRRVANIIGAYEISKTDVSRKRIILVDDILTTGATVSECARVLKTAGADKIYVLTLAKTRTRKK